MNSIYIVQTRHVYGSTQSLQIHARSDVATSLVLHICICTCRGAKLSIWMAMVNYEHNLLFSDKIYN
jgi:hypothetical protein